MDFITHLPTTLRGFSAILVVVDRFSKMAHFIPTTTDVSAVETAHLFRDNVFRLHGLPGEIISDRDSRFASEFWQTLYDLLGTDIRLSTSFHPQTDGQTERINGTLEQMLRMYVSPALTDWDECLAVAEFAYNNARHSSTGYAPFVLNSGRKPRVPASLRRCGDMQDLAPDVQAFVTQMETMRRHAKSCLHAAQQRQKAFADQQRRDIEFSVGDLVLLDTRNLRLHLTVGKKLLPRRVGPFRVRERIGSVAYRLHLPTLWKVHDVFHVSLLAPWKGDAEVQPDAFVFSDEDQVKPDRILGHRDRKRGNKVIKSYLTTWSGCGPDHITWEPEPYLPRDLVDEYWRDLAARQSTIPLGSTPRNRPIRRSRRVANRGMPYYGERQEELLSEGEEPGSG
jgi:hypothetical protein